MKTSEISYVPFMEPHVPCPQNALKLSREGNIIEMKKILNAKELVNISWGNVMFEAAYAKISTDVKKEMLWMLSEKISGNHQDRNDICQEFFELGSN